MKILKSQLFKQLTVLVILIGILVSSVVCTQASIYQVSVLFGTSARTNVFQSKTDNAGSVGDINSYPIKYSSDDIGPEFSQLGFDILLGTKRDMVSYTGEIPKEWKDKEGLTLVPYSNYSTMSKEYWGIDTPNNKIKDWGVEDGKEYDFVEEMAGEKGGDTGLSEVTSIRMYALTKSSSFTIVKNGFSQIFYVITQGLCDLTAGILKVFIAVKNVSIAKVLEELNLEKLVKLFNKVLIQNEGQLSIFMIVAIISFIFAVVGWVFNYVKGGKKTSSFKDILILGFCGITVVGMCLSGNPTSLGTNAANAVNKLTMALVYDSVAGGTDIWQSKEKKSITNDSTEISYNETTLINKTLIELQILNQFGVQDISDLDVTKFDNVTEIGFTKLNSTPGEKDLKNFGNNLGYYYWFANSPSPDYNSNLTNTYRNGVYNSGKIDVRLEGIMSYLQKAYNNGDSKTKARILSIVDHFANPSTFNGAIIYLLLTIEYILLALVLARLVLKILLAKILISGSVLGLPIAGPLLITTRKKCVSIAKLILMVLVTYSIQVFVLSVLFDLILNVIGVLISPNILNVVLSMAVTVGLFIFLPNLYRKLDRLFAAINQSIGAGDINRYQASAARAVSSKFNGLKGKTRQKYVTEVDADGVEHTMAVQQTRGISKAAAVTAMLAGYGDGNRGTNIRNIKKIDESRRTDRIARAKGLSDKVHDQTNEAFNGFNNRKEEIMRNIYGLDKNGQRNFNNINSAALSSEDRTEYNMLRGEYESVLNNQRYIELQNKQSKLGPGEKLSDNEQFELNQYSNKLADIGGRQDQFNSRIQQKVHDQVVEERGDQVATAVNKEIRTNVKATEQAKSKSKILKFAAAVDPNTPNNTDADSIVKNSVETIHKELKDIHQMSPSNPQKELDHARASAQMGTASKEQAQIIKDNRGTQTTTAEGSQHQRFGNTVQEELNKRKKSRNPFKK